MCVYIYISVSLLYSCANIRVSYFLQFHNVLMPDSVSPPALFFCETALASLGPGHFQISSLYILELAYSIQNKTLCWELDWDQTESVE